MPLQGKPISPKEFLKSNLDVKGSYIKTNYDKDVSSELVDEEMFIGSVFSSDLSLTQKNNQENTKGLYKRFGLTRPWKNDTG